MNLSLFNRAFTMAALSLGAALAAPGVPASWQQAPASRKRDTAALMTWWKQFDDPTLHALISKSLGQNPDLKTAASRIQQARSTLGIAKTALLPAANIGTSARASRIDSRSNGESSSDRSSGAIDAGWELDLFGRRRAEVAAATAEIARSEENFHAAQASLAAEIASAYVSLRLSESLLEVTQRNLKLREETVQLTRWKEDAGMGNALETQQALTTLEQAKASIPSLRQSIAQARNQLAILCGQSPGTLDTLLGKSRSIPAAPERLAIGIPADTLRQRPDVQAAERGLEAAVARTAAARKQRLPSLNLSGSLGIEALKAGKLFSPESTVGSLVGGLTAPVFDAGRIRRNIEIQTEQQHQAWFAYESTVLTALAEVENALIAVKRIGERREVLSRATTAAEQAASLAAMQHEAGQVDLLNVLDTQRTLLGLEEQQANAAASQANAHIQLFKALGGGVTTL